MDLSVVIVNYNVKDHLRSLLASIPRCTRGLSTEVFVVDNNSRDGSQAMVASEFLWVYLIANEHNLGFARANNQAIRLCRGRYVLLTNPDVVLGEDTLRTMTAFLQSHDDAGAAGCKVLNPDGTLQLACRRGAPTLPNVFFKITGLSDLFPRSRIFGAYNLTYLDPNSTHEVDAVSGSFFMIRAEVVRQIGLLDEKFFMFGEDLDWFWRIRQAGWRIYYLPTTGVIHFKGESIRQSNRSVAGDFYRAMYIFARKHFSKEVFGWRVSK